MLAALNNQVVLSSFPRSAWECIQGRSASRFAPRRYRHSHAERGNERLSFVYLLI